jgi:paraquat-inducible protein B
MADGQVPHPSVPQARAVAKKQTRFSFVWIIPIVAALAGAWVAVTRILSEGPKITIVFQSADGLEAGKTKINYRGVDVGTLSSIRLSDDHLQVFATAQMEPHTENFLVDDTQFWVVRPRISGSTVSGLGTLISGAFVGMEIGASKESKRDFVALATPPVISSDVPGRLFELKTTDLGSLDSGTPLFFRRLQVGQVVSYVLDSNGQFFTVKVFVKKPYDDFVTPNTRFWQASGVDMQLSASGLSVQTQSLLSILIGGVAFETPQDLKVLPAAEAETTFNLYENRAAAYQPAPRHPQIYQLIFNESVRGLEIGAPVEFRGIQVGQVTGIRAQVNMQTFKFSIPVTIELDAEKLGVHMMDLAPGVDFAGLRRKLIDSLIHDGARAQLRSANFLTGSAMVAIDIFPHTPPAEVDWSDNPPRLPTIPGQLEATEASVTNILKKLDDMPLKEIGDNVNKTLGDLDLTLVSARGTLLSARGTLNNASDTFVSANGLVHPNSPQMQQLSNTLQEVSRAARSLRVLADYLEQHPDALLRGKTGKAK